ncbi:hypothetical protein SCP_0100670 [Sparassis crispa]|uniref:Uncharacterized protein n=1 Tax=Sparassis crispa TaxID=139825 RepID=A0A401G4V5_9APHY|nr:hypothetical protein SCP_0100670 [Sparassis crispa]GBE77195.1 hypothetical protein SCP_0100670 [Sparassis crispa]
MFVACAVKSGHIIDPHCHHGIDYVIGVALAVITLYRPARLFARRSLKACPHPSSYPEIRSRSIISGLAI